MRHMVRAGLSRETDYMRKYNNKLLSKQKKMKSIKIKGFHIVFILITVSAIAFVIYQTGHFLLTWEKLNVSTFKLSNSPQLRFARVREILGGFSGNILTLDLDELRKKLSGVPAVEDVYLNRNLPSTIDIRFILRKPVFQVEINEKYNIIDREGVILYKSKESRNELITIRNVRFGKQQKIIPYLAQLNVIKDAIEHVTLVEPYGLRLKIKGINETFYPGDTDFAGKIEHYLRIRKKLFLDKNKIRNVDLRFEDRFYLEYEEEVKRENEE
ncbi:MAG: FtsQ-type POTRA domain-containing protein [bacterium]|nr:FtsQ-type POTRA domain-containing protein [bacterium]